MSEEICNLCGKPRGTGTLLDASPEPPPVNTSIGSLVGAVMVEQGESTYEQLVGGRRKGGPAISVKVWREFAAKYSCLACAEHRGG